VHPHLIHGSLGPPESSTHCTAHRKVSLYFTMGRPFPPLKIAPSHRGSGPPLIVVPWAHPSPQPKWHLDRFSRFCRAHHCDSLTDHAIQCVTIRHSSICSTAMRPNNNDSRVNYTRSNTQANVYGAALLHSHHNSLPDSCNECRVCQGTASPQMKQPPLATTHIHHCHLCLNQNMT